MISIDQQLTAFFVSKYNEDKSTLKFCVDMEVPKITIGHTYKQFVKEELLIPIEKLPDEEKETLRQELIKLDIPVTKFSAKILHTIKFINNNS